MSISLDSLPIVFEKHRDLRMMGVFSAYIFMFLAFFMAIPRRRQQWRVHDSSTDDDPRYRMLRQNDDILVDFFAAGMVVVPFVPASNLFFLVGTTIGERLLYPCSVGGCLLVCRLLFEEDALLGLGDPSSNGSSFGGAGGAAISAGGGGVVVEDDGAAGVDGSSRESPPPAASPLEGSKDSQFSPHMAEEDEEDSLMAEAMACLDQERAFDLVGLSGSAGSSSRRGNWRARHRIDDLGAPAQNFWGFFRLGFIRGKFCGQHSWVLLSQVDG